MTYTVSGGTLNPTHSLNYKQLIQLLAIFHFVMK